MALNRPSHAPNRIRTMGSIHLEQARALMAPLLSHADVLVVDVVTLTNSRGEVDSETGSNG